MTETLTAADQIIERRRHEGEVLLAAIRERERESRKEWESYCRSLPQVPYTATPDPEPGEGFVMCDRQVFAYDRRDRRVYVAGMPGMWLPAKRAEALGIEGQSVVLVARK